MAANPQPTRSWNADVLQPLRNQGDPLADAVIAELVADRGVAAMNSLMQSFVANEHAIPADLPAPVKLYFEQASVLPPWADPARIAAGEDLFWRFGPRVVLILLDYSLPFCYLGRNGVPVLALTNRLGSNPTRRIVETAQMVVDVMRQGGLTTDGGRGRLTIQKVRLMHAAIRRLAPTAPSWKTEFGLPVNQEDLVGTMLSFSWVTPDGLEKIGVELTDRDRDAYIHCWNVVGHLLGVHDDLLPASTAEAKSLALAIAAHQFGPTPEGKALTKALIDMQAGLLPGNVFDAVPRLMIRYFLGKQWAECLGVDEGFLAGLAATPLRFGGITFSGAIEDSQILSAIAEKVGRVLIDSLVFVARGGNRPGFAIPVDLRQQWGLNWTS